MKKKPTVVKQDLKAPTQIEEDLKPLQALM